MSYQQIHDNPEVPTENFEAAKAFGRTIYEALGVNNQLHAVAQAALHGVIKAEKGLIGPTPDKVVPIFYEKDTVVDLDRPAFAVPPSHPLHEFAAITLYKQAA
jgi:hypothetical protein